MWGLNARANAGRSGVCHLNPTRLTDRFAVFASRIGIARMQLIRQFKGIRILIAGQCVIPTSDETCIFQKFMQAIIQECN